MDPFPSNSNSPFNGKSDFDRLKADEVEEVRRPHEVFIDPEIQERAADTTRTLRRLFLILLGGGIAVGILLAIALVLLLNYWGLTDKPNHPSDREGSFGLPSVILGEVVHLDIEHNG